MVTNVDVGTINNNLPSDKNSTKCLSHPQMCQAADDVWVGISTYGKFVSPLLLSHSLLSIIQVKMRLVHNFHNVSLSSWTKHASFVIVADPW